MESKAAFLFLFLVTYEILLTSSLEIFPPYKNDMTVCEMNSKGRAVGKGKKSLIKNCKITCAYPENVLEEYNSPDGQDCCAVGLISTGVCKDGLCPPNPIELLKGMQSS